MNDAYEALRSKMKGCMECPLCATRNEVVVDRGATTSRLLFIGEAPGASEDASGQAFVGQAGAHLDELIAEAGIPADRFLIVNTLKCRPPENKYPGEDDSRFRVEDTVRKCLPWLDQQIELVQPKVIVLVGHKAAAWTVYRDKRGPIPPMSDLFGQWIRADRYPGIQFFGMYHTSYLLRAKEKSVEQAAILRAETLKVLRWAWGVIQGNLPEAPIIHVRGEDKRYEQLKFF